MTTEEGIVVRTYDFRETSLIIDLITPISGKKRILAKGARDPVRGYTGIFLPTNNVIVNYYSGKNISLLSHAELRDFFPLLRGDFLRYAFALSFLELVYILLAPLERNFYSFSLQTIRFLDEQKKLDYLLLSSFVWFKLLNFSGFYPYLEGCLCCGKESKIFFYSVDKGGLICEECRKKINQPHLMVIDSETLGGLRGMKKLDFSLLSKWKINLMSKFKIKEIMKAHLLYRIEKKPPSLQFWEAVENLLL